MAYDYLSIFEKLVDFLMPELTPYESSLYIFLLRHSLIKNGTLTVRIGKRTIASNFVKGVRGNRANFAHITSVLKELEKKGCIKVGDTNREGTIYSIILPEQVPLVAKKLEVLNQPEEEDYFNDEEKRREIFERDKWLCCYCGEMVTSGNSTLDHLIPQHKGGGHTKGNLKTCCLLCNSIKSGKTYEEAAPFLLKSIQERKVRSKNNQSK